MFLLQGPLRTAKKKREEERRETARARAEETDASLAQTAAPGRAPTATPLPQGAPTLTSWATSTAVLGLLSRGNPLASLAQCSTSKARAQPAQIFVVCPCSSGGCRHREGE